ncbi:MAG: HEAT repeat domain-containing protein [Planctomycetaceae bacterium]|nr:HEAT repeat domain-containing protein [Planctomycetaceae bacterium]
MRYLTFCFLFLFAVSVVKANDVATIQSYLDNKTDNVQILHGVYTACLNLTRTGTAEAVPVLKKLLEDERFTTVAQTALINMPGGEKRVPPIQPELPQDAVLLALILRDGEPGLSAFTTALKDEKASFMVIQRAILDLKSDKTGTIVLDNMGNRPTWQQAALVFNLGARKDSTAIVPRLMELAKSDKPELRLATVQVLGEIGDPRAVDTLLLAAAGADAELAKATTESLKRFTGDEFNKKIIALLDGNDKQLLPSALNGID